MPARIKNPAEAVPGAMQSILALNAAIEQGGVPRSTLHLAHQRASQINGCRLCIQWGTHEARQAGESEERLAAVAGWREASCFTEAERAALALAEEVTRLADRTDPVPDAVWNEAARHYDERALAALVLSIALTNLFNRVNVSTRQEAASWAGQAAPAS